MARFRWLIVITALLVVSAGSPVASAANGFALSVPGGLDTPTRSISLSGGTYEVSAVGRTQQGESFTVDATVPPGTDYRVLIYDADQNLVDQQPGTNDQTFSFTASSSVYQPGSYAISLFYDGVHQTIHPLVVRGYRVTLAAPSEAETDATIDVSITTTHTAGSKDIDTVEVAVVNDTETIRREASEESDGTYTAAVDLAGLDPGTYQVYAAVRGEKEAFGKKERLGVSDANTLDIGTSSESGNDGDGSDSGGDSDESDAGDSGDNEDADAESDTENDQSPTNSERTTSQSDSTNGDQTERGTDGTEGAPDPSGVQEQSTGESTAQATPSTDAPTAAGTSPTASNVITPVSQPTTSSPAEFPTLTGFGVLVALLAIVLVGVLARHRSG